MPKNSLDRLRYLVLLKDEATLRDLCVLQREATPARNELQELEYCYCYLYHNGQDPKGWRNDGFRASWDCKSHWSFPMKGKLKRKIDKINIDTNRELHRWATQLNLAPRFANGPSRPEEHTFVEYFVKTKGKQSLAPSDEAKSAVGAIGTFASRRRLALPPSIPVHSWFKYSPGEGTPASSSTSSSSPLPENFTKMMVPAPSSSSSSCFSTSSSSSASSPSSSTTTTSSSHEDISSNGLVVASQVHSQTSSPFTIGMSAVTQFTTSSPRGLIPIPVGMGYDSYNSGTSFSVPTPYSLKNSSGNYSLEGIESKASPENSSEFRVISPVTLPPNDWMQAASFYHALSRTNAPSPLSFPTSPLSSFFAYPTATPSPTPAPSPTPVFSIPSSPLSWQAQATANNISPSVNLWQQLQEWAVLLDQLSVAQKEMIWAYFRSSPYFQFFQTNHVSDQFKPSPESESFTSLIERWRQSATFFNLANPAILIFCAAVKQIIAARPTTSLVNQEPTEQRRGDEDQDRDRERNKVRTSTSPINDDESKTPRSKAMDVSSLVS